MRVGIEEAWGGEQELNRPGEESRHCRGLGMRVGIEEAWGQEHEEAWG